MCFWQKARYDTRESTFSEDCEFFQCQGEPRPRLRFPETVAHRLCPDGHDQPPMPSMPSSSIIHVSGGICALNGPPARPPLWSGRGCGPWLRGGRDTFYPAPPCWAEAGGGPRVIARHYIDKICCPRYGHLAGRSLWAAGWHATCNLVGSAEGGECKKSIAAGVPLKMAHRSYCSLSSHSITAHTGVQLLILGYDCLPKFLLQI